MKILVTDPIHPNGIKLLKNEGFTVDEKYGICTDNLKQIIEEYEVLIVRSATKVTKEVILAGTRLRLIGRAGVGLDNVDTITAAHQKVQVINTPAVSTVSVAELVMGFMISSYRKIPQATMSLKSGKWEKSRFYGLELEGKTLGIIGFGRIGKEVAKRASAFNMHILVFDHSASAGSVSLDYLLANSDIITVHVPLTPETKHMISKTEVAKMKKGMVIINTSRGGIVDEEALKEGLEKGIISSVALDVFETEPVINNPLLSFESFIGTPHIGAQTEEAQIRASIELARLIVETLTEGAR